MTVSTHELACDFIAAGDGFHASAAPAVKSSAIETFETSLSVSAGSAYPPATPPSRMELIYANHALGFALCTMRSTHRSRYDVQGVLD